MEKTPGSRSGLFLMELMISILFFSVAAAICVLLFVKARTLEEDSVNLNHAVHACTSVAEVVRSQTEPLDMLKASYPNGKLSENGYTIYYDKDWAACNEAASLFSLELTLSQEGSLVSGSIWLLEGKDILYSLEVQKFITGEAAL